MTRPLLTLVSVSLSALFVGALPLYAQSSSGSGCGTETWSTDKMAYVGVPCADSQTPQQAAVPLTDAQYCGALVARYDTFLNKEGKSGSMRSTDNAANVAAAKCRSGDRSGIADLERALKDAKIGLPPRS